MFSSIFIFSYFFVLISTITSYIYGMTMNGDKTPNGRITMEMMVVAAGAQNVMSEACFFFFQLFLTLLTFIF